MSDGPPPDAATERCRVLVVGTDDWAVDQAVSTLRNAGLETFRCHDSGQPAFPCNRFRPGGRCPVDNGVDVVADVRSRFGTDATPGEMGALCGLRAGIPLIAVGLAEGTPFNGLATVTMRPGEDLASTCVAVAHMVDLSPAEALTT